MLKDTESLFQGEKCVREFNRKIADICIDQLVREDLELDEKQWIANHLKNILDDGSQWEENNSDFWYKYGVCAGKLRGALMLTGAVAVGLAIGKRISR